MPAAKTRYRTDSDGLPAREVGQWVVRKNFFVDRYVDIFSKAMKDKWKRRVYVELFAGPGRSFDKNRQKFADGSALRAIKANFTDYILVDIDERATGALQQRIDKSGIVGKTVHVITEDCNQAVPEVLSLIPKGALTLTFIDPTNWQISLDTVSKLSRGKPMDLLVTFHYGSMKRVKDSAGLTRFFGTKKWQSGWGPAYWYGLYNQQLEPLGYLNDCHLQSETVKNSKNAPMYGLVLFTKKQLGLDFWKKVRTRDENEQLRFRLGR